MTWDWNQESWNGSEEEAASSLDGHGRGQFQKHTWGASAWPGCREVSGGKARPESNSWGGFGGKALSGLGLSLRICGIGAQVLLLGHCGVKGQGVGGEGGHCACVRAEWLDS